MKKPWGGRFKQSTDALMEKFSSSIAFDRRLYACDIEGSVAHCMTLAKAGILTQAEAGKIVSGLKKVLAEIESGKFEFDESLEDVHMNVERRLTQLVGPVGGKLHTGRSRNDQVCLDARLYLRKETAAVLELIARLGKALLEQARRNVDVVVPGYTHLQRAQPVRLAHHLLAHLEALLRDRERFADALKRIDVMPLGSAALAGSNYPVDRRYTAKLLGFPEVSHNSMDAVGDRDFAVEFVSAAAILMMHLSRFCEEIVLWSSAEFGFLELSDAFTTGSSIMPQKKNPDAAELVRGKSGRVYGHLMALLAMMKSLPLAYNRDLQEDKEAVFDTADTVKMSLAVMAGMVATARFKPPSPERLESEGFLTATEAADYLVLKGVPFREAHESVGQTVAYCLQKGKSLARLSLAEFKAISPRFEADVFKCLSAEKSVERKAVYGGTARKRVLEQIARLDKIFKSMEKRRGKSS
ncbi:MAG: argininosuccinate lyase [Nitrospinae bacterium]|nr:argininosuccinate lyase [Nitrospinota bacterium]